MEDIASISERSYGIILLRQNPNESPALKPRIESLQVLLVYQRTLRAERKFYWGFPKGHPEKHDLTPKETAIRELEEETGISIDLDSIQDLDEVLQTVHINPITQKPKVSRFWVAMLTEEQDVKVQEEEIADHRWCGWDEGVELLTFDDLKRLLCRVRGLMASCKELVG